MKVGILTLPLNNNYGGILQAFALRSILLQLGHEPTLIMRRQNIGQITKLYKIKFAVKRIIQSILYRKRLSILFTDVVDFQYKGKFLRDFINGNLSPMTPFVYSTEELVETIQGKFDAIIVGSDQVWRPDYVNCISNMFLDFTEGWNIKRIAYAASFGSEHVIFSDDQKIQFGHLFSKFDAISVREKSALSVIDSLKWANREIETVLDPTILLDQSSYRKLIGNKNSKTNYPYIFGYILDSDNSEVPDLISLIEEKTSLKIKSIFDLKRWKRVEYVMPPVESWLEGVINSSFVITDSFHGTVFSILFNKPFITYANPKRGIARIKDLLEDYGLTNRIVSTTEDVQKINLFDIDWEYVNSMLSKNKEKSLNYLKRNL